MGLPVDAMDMQGAVTQVCHAIEQNQSLFLSTPNLNFLVGALEDSDFRQSVVDSDLSLADGMPLIWMARALNFPIKERVSGSGLIEALIESDECCSNPIKVFFFGGEEGVAELACQRLQERSCGLVGVGSYYPGFGSIEEMSAPQIIDRINQSGAEFVIVSLGAKKGQAWIQRNRHSLNAPVVSHLGAVVNFVAGTTKRAPAIYQRLGFEWLWRIKEEPKLWRRYSGDGLKLLQLLATRLLPHVLFNFRYRHEAANPAASVEISRTADHYRLQIRGVVTSENLMLINDQIGDIAAGATITLDVAELEFADSSFVGFIFLLKKDFGNRLEVLGARKRIRKIFKYTCADYLLS